MKKPKAGHNWFFVDESGDPTFYNSNGECIIGKEGCSPILILGFIETTNPHRLRQEVLKLQQEIVDDPYFIGVPSIDKTRVALHAKDDLPEVRYRVFKRLAELDYHAQFIVARKVEKVFVANYKRDPGRFYDELITSLFRIGVTQLNHCLAICGTYCPNTTPTYGGCIRQLRNSYQECPTSTRAQYDRVFQTRFT